MYYGECKSDRMLDDAYLNLNWFINLQPTSNNRENTFTWQLAFRSSLGIKNDQK